MLSIVVGLRDPDLRRRVAVRRGVRGLSVRRRDVPPERHPEAAHPLHDRARRVQLHHGCPAGHAADPEHHPDDVLQDHDLGRALARPDRQPCSFSSSASPTSRAGAGAAQARGEGYGTELRNEPEPFEDEKLPNPWIALSPLVVVGVANFLLTHADSAGLRRDARDQARRPADRHQDRRRGGDLGGRRRAAARHPDRVRLRLAAGASPGSPTAARRRSPERCWRR